MSTLLSFNAVSLMHSKAQIIFGECHWPFVSKYRLVSENSFRREGIISCRVCKPVFALSSKIIFRSGAPKKMVSKPCFVDYQSAVVGILRNKASSENRFPREGINFSGIANSVNGNFLID